MPHLYPYTTTTTFGSLLIWFISLYYWFPILPPPAFTSFPLYFTIPLWKRLPSLPLPATTTPFYPVGSFVVVILLPYATVLVSTCGYLQGFYAHAFIHTTYCVYHIQNTTYLLPTYTLPFYLHSTHPLFLFGSLVLLLADMPHATHTCLLCLYFCSLPLYIWLFILLRCITCIPFWLVPTPPFPFTTFTHALPCTCAFCTQLAGGTLYAARNYLTPPYLFYILHPFISPAITLTVQRFSLYYLHSTTLHFPFYTHIAPLLPLHTRFTTYIPLLPLMIYTTHTWFTMLAYYIVATHTFIFMRFTLLPRFTCAAAPRSLLRVAGFRILVRQRAACLVRATAHRLLPHTTPRVAAFCYHHAFAPFGVPVVGYAAPHALLLPYWLGPRVRRSRPTPFLPPALRLRFTTHHHRFHRRTAGIGSSLPLPLDVRAYRFIFLPARCHHRFRSPPYVHLRFTTWVTFLPALPFTLPSTAATAFRAPLRVILPADCPLRCLPRTCQRCLPLLLPVRCRAFTHHVALFIPRAHAVHACACHRLPHFAFAHYLHYLCYVLFTPSVCLAWVLYTPPPLPPHTHCTLPAFMPAVHYCTFCMPPPFYALRLFLHLFTFVVNFYFGYTLYLYWFGLRHRCGSLLPLCVADGCLPPHTTTHFVRIAISPRGLP